MNLPVHVLFNIPMLGCFLIKYQIQINYKLTMGKISNIVQVT